MPQPGQLPEIMQMQGSTSVVPENAQEYYTNSFSEVLFKSIGYYVVCDFLIGSNNIVTKEGILYTSGVNFLTLQDPVNGRFTVCDLYALKFVTIYEEPPRNLPAGSRSQNRSRANPR